MAIDQSFHPAYCIRKVKLLCSFGGKFLHRPYDWTLRYVGGHSRIIVVPRDITLPQLCRKLSHVFGAPVAIRYQLPNQETDDENMVSVYAEEDLKYMMEEFDKLAQPSAKLHVFLFTQSEIASILAPSELTLIDLCDGGREYFEAVKATFSASHAAAIYSCQIHSPKDTHNSNTDIPSSPSKGNLDPLSEEDQSGESFAYHMPHPNLKKDFHLSLSQTLPLQPWLFPPPSIEPYGLHPHPPLNHMDCNLGSIAEKIDHSKLRHPLAALGLSEDLRICPQSLTPSHLPLPSIQLYGLHHMEFYSSHTFMEEGALHPPVDYLFKESCPNPFIDFGEYYLHDLAHRVGELLQDMLECWKSYSTFVEFKQDEGVPFVVIFGLEMEHEDEDSRRIQQDIFIKIMSYVEINISSYELILLEVLSQANDSSTWSKF